MLLEFVPRPDNGTYDTFMFFWFMVLLASVGLMRLANERLPVYLLTSAFTFSDRIDRFSDERAGDTASNLVLSFAFVNVPALLITRYLEAFGVAEYFVWLGLSGAVYVLYLVALFLFTSIFFRELRREVHLNRVLEFDRTTAMLLLPLLMVLYFTDITRESLWFYTVPVLLLVLWVLRDYRLFKDLTQITPNSSWYVAVYLLVFEVVPPIYIILHITQSVN